MKSIKKLRKMLEGHGTHHPFCRFYYEHTKGDWECQCKFLDVYDQWRELPERFKV
jgi:hypothetical protein